MIEVNLLDGLMDQNITRKNEIQDSYVADTVSIVDAAFEKRLNHQSFSDLDLGQLKVILDMS